MDTPKTGIRRVLYNVSEGGVVDDDQVRDEIIDRFVRRNHLVVFMEAFIHF